MVFSVRLW
uniref:Uncharacterized protein n=1 Tax=Anguilla anguilla TaxID=7936 RepID=A0A0E9RLJ2_ANGAN